MDLHTLTVTSLLGAEHAATLHAIDSGSSSNWSIESYASHLSTGATFAALDGENIVGFIAAIVTEEFVEVVNLCVEQHQRNKGYASQLFLALFASHEGKEFFLEARQSNIAALSLYKKLGFTPYHVRTGYYSDGESAVQLRKKPLIIG